MTTNKILNVLIVEDELTLREVYATILSLQGFRVVTAINGIEALNEISKNVPDVVLLDVLMPEMDGRDFLRNLDIDNYPAMKIIITSNIADQAIIEEMISLGAHKHVLKASMTPNNLVDEVQTIAVNG